MQLITAPPSITANIFDTVSAYMNGSFGTLAIFIIGIVAVFWIIDLVITKFQNAKNKNRENELQYIYDDPEKEHPIQTLNRFDRS
jgi:uncharacterized membrane protein YdbT with pleckstrin-like domain